MVVTSDKTQTNKFIARNWYRAFRQLGYITQLVVEREPYEFLSGALVIEGAAAFRPHIVFHINWAVREFFPVDEVSGRLLWMMRFRDANRLLSGASYPHHMFVFCHLRRWLAPLERAGISEDRLVYLPDGVDANVFRPRPEQAGDPRYACDVVSVTNTAGGDREARRQLIEMTPAGPLRETVEGLCGDIAAMARAGQYLFFEASFGRLLEDRLKRRGLNLEVPSKEYLAQHMGVLMGTYFRRHVVEWILDSGITSNVRVWGSSWSNYPRFRSLHGGVARYGEELAAIYQNSRIAISDQSYFTMHERNFEIFASGGFPIIKLSNPAAEGVVLAEDIDQITNHLVEDEEVVMFRGKEDLLQKVARYLERPDERDQIAARGRAAILHRFTTVRIASQAMDYLRAWHDEHA
jgi:spore maturation protein CgeB